MLTSPMIISFNSVGTSFHLMISHCALPSVYSFALSSPVSICSCSVVWQALQQLLFEQQEIVLPAAAAAAVPGAQQDGVFCERSFPAF